MKHGTHGSRRLSTPRAGLGGGGRGRRRLLAALAVSCAVTTGAAMASQAAPVASRPPTTTANASPGADSPCSGLYLISARGSGQSYKGPTDMTVSPETNAVLLALQKELTAKGVTVTVTVHQLSYPAPSVNILTSDLHSANVLSDWDQLMHTNLPKYIGEEEQGEAELYGYLTQIYYGCYPTGQEPMIALAGYSQGAMVVHNVLNTLVANNQVNYMSMIKGAVLIADPERMPSSDITNLGTASPGDYGLCHALDSLIIPHSNSESCVPPNTTVDVASYFASVATQVCNKNDIVCDTSGLFKLNSDAVPTAQKWSTLEKEKELGEQVHTESYHGSGLTKAGQEIALGLIQDGLGNAPAGNGSWTASEAPGGNSTCAIQTGGTLWCWGYNGYGQLGIGNQTNELLPTQVGTGATWTTVSAGDTWACAIRTAGTLWCWGDNNYGQLGTGDTANRLTPTQIGTAATWASVSAGAGNTCAIETNGTLWCWGDNSQGELGTGDTTNQLTPTPVGNATNWATISAGAEDPCATRQDGTLWCWGLNSNGQLGTGDTVNRLTPTQVGTATNWATVSADDSTCAIRTAGTLWCWGVGSTGQLGTGNTSNQLTPVQVGTATTWTKVTAGQDFACATQQDGTLWCWGSNSNGQLGTGNQTSQLAPTRVGSATNWNGVAASIYVSVCATRTDQTLWCWGDGGDGQLGSGSTNSLLVPMEVQ
jgi:alpha-tubulin suppressor-like RCC1 family protein